MLNLFHINRDSRLITGFILVSITLSCSNQKKDSSEQIAYNQTTNTKIFESISSETSNIVFSNDLKENVETYDNVFNFDYFYNGAGVAVEDINNDGLLDIIFSGNQVENKLYLNKGDFKFEDISKSSGINTGKKWSNGVTFVDINNDGWQDIYISQGGPNNRSNRNNLLFINNHDLTFTEKAQELGLDDPGISLDPISLLKTVNTSDETRYFNSSHFYKNVNGKFIDATKEVGIENPIFGLGLCVSDINEDGYLDIYISSDYYLPDAIYLNNQNGSFKNSVKDLTTRYIRLRYGL